MLTVLNLFILLALLIMVAIWATYGFFSAFIQLIVTIGAGVLAFVLWEPVAYMLLGRMPTYAHGIGLLAPFAILLILLRIPFNQFCKANVHMPRLADQIGGGACGLCSGILAFGMMLNGVNLMPVERDVMGWEPYKVQGNKVTENPDGQLWSFLRIHQWSARFFNMLSSGSMHPTGGTPLAAGRPDLSKRSVLTRLTPDPNQMRIATPDHLAVTGVYRIPATEDAILKLVHRSAVLAFLNPSYKVPENIIYGNNGLGLVDSIVNELQSRAQDPKANGDPLAMLNTDAIRDVSATAQFKFYDAQNPERFPRFVEMVADKMGADLVNRLSSVMGEDKVLYIVDTHWDKHAGTFNLEDDKLRVAFSQIAVAVEGETIAPIGYAIEFSQNNRGRVFTEVISDQADVSTRDSAYASGAEVNLSWIFSLPKDQSPDWFFARGLRFDLSTLPTPQGQDSPVNENLGAVAHVVGIPLLPSAKEAAASDAAGANDLRAQGVKIAGTNAYADVNEQLPGAFSGSAASMNLDKDADPWLLISGQSKRVIFGRGGKKSSVRAIQVSGSDRLVRIQLDGQKAKSLYGRAIGVAKDLNVMRVKGQGGKAYDAIGFALLRADGSMHLDIRADARLRGLSASELPDVKADEKLVVYFPVEIGEKLVAYVLGTEEQAFERPLLVEKASP